MSALAAAAIAYFNFALQWVQQPTVYTSAGVFLFMLWTYIGLTVLRDRQKPQFVRVAHDYAYGLILDGGWQPTFAKFASNHPNSPNAEAIMITCNYRNVSAGPLRMKIEEFRVILNNRTNDDSEIVPEQIFARLAPMGIRCGGVPRDASESHLTGKLSLKFLYGHPDGDFVRRYTLKLNIQIAIDTLTKQFSISDHSVDIKDEPYGLVR